MDRFLEPTIPMGNEGFNNLIKQSIGKELSLANLQREDLKSFVEAFGTAQIMLIHGQDRLARFILTISISELKLSMSIDADFSHLLLREKLEYTQTQNVHEFVHEPARKKFFGGSR